MQPVVETGEGRPRAWSARLFAALCCPTPAAALAAPRLRRNRPRGHRSPPPPAEDQTNATGPGGFRPGGVSGVCDEWQPGRAGGAGGVRLLVDRVKGHWRVHRMRSRRKRNPLTPPARRLMRRRTGSRNGLSDERKVPLVCHSWPPAEGGRCAAANSFGHNKKSSRGREPRDADRPADAPRRPPCSRTRSISPHSGAGRARCREPMSVPQTFAAASRLVEAFLDATAEMPQADAASVAGVSLPTLQRWARQLPRILRPPIRERITSFLARANS